MARRKIVFNCSYIFTFNIECSSLNHRGQTENGLNVGEEDMLILILDQFALLIYLQPPLSAYSQL